MSNGTAPVCPISHSQPTQPTPSGKTTIPVIPKVSDLITALLALRALNQALQSITKGAPHINNVYPAKPIDQRVPFAGYARGTWKETGRTYQVAQLVNPDFPSQTIGIRQVASVDFLENATGNTLRYSVK